MLMTWDLDGNFFFLKDRVLNVCVFLFFYNRRLSMWLFSLYILFDVKRKIFYSMTVKLTEKSEFPPRPPILTGRKIWPGVGNTWGLPVLLRTAWQEGFVSGMGGRGGRGVESEILTPTPTAEGDICCESRAHSSVLGLYCDLLYHHCTMHMPYFAFTQPSYRLLPKNVSSWRQGVEPWRLCNNTQNIRSR
jgi:hypothetical protein